MKQLVLVGGGHSHVEVLRRFGCDPLPEIGLTLISRDTHTPYSGMLPGYIAGHYRHEQMHIDLRRLARFAGARFIHDSACGIDRQARRVLCRDGGMIDYHWLAINIGSSPMMHRVPGAAEHALPVKPIHQFNQRWLALLERVRQHQGTSRIAVVGGGAGGVELVLAMQYRLRRELAATGRDPDELKFALFSASQELLPTQNARVRRMFARTLAARGVIVQRDCPVVAVEAGAVHSADGTEWPADEIVWVTQAGGAPWLAETGLALDDSGCILVRDSLQSLNDERILAAGDIATMANHAREKAGVIAVRQGPALARNLARLAGGRPALPFRPQKRWLALISTGDRFAVASRGRIGFQGRWVWHWKDWIDRRFMRRYQHLRPTEAVDNDRS